MLIGRRDELLDPVKILAFRVVVLVEKPSMLLPCSLHALFRPVLRHIPCRHEFFRIQISCVLVGKRCMVFK